jgi:hypothetical protein
MEGGSRGEQPKLLPVTEGTPQFKNIIISDVNCKGACQGIFLQGLPEIDLENIHLANVSTRLSFYNVINVIQVKLTFKSLLLFETNRKRILNRLYGFLQL